ncbi:MAG: endonuclease III [Firmicutes bacterium ML8_F2]|nr:MAG: endonuclease III [Firmicutes bacterium ML8_F2]
MKILEKERIRLILKLLAEHYPLAKTSLVFKNKYQLFVATVLSAQTTDEQVNKITVKLFDDISSFSAMAKMTPEELEQYVKSCGLYKNKSRSLVKASKIIEKQYGGSLPESFDELVKLPGVGRKTANIIISVGFKKAALAVDTHVFRVSKRLGIADGTDVISVEEQLKKVIRKENWIDLHHRLIAHGRAVCSARNPRCDQCFLASLCFYVQKKGEI